MTRRHLVVRGRVQGIGFRWFARKTAESLGLTGWARNREDGSVEIEVEGDGGGIDGFIDRLRSGNPAARVESIEARTIATRGDRGFQTR